MTVINIFNQIENNLIIFKNYRKASKINNLSLWEKIFGTIDKFNLKITRIKVKAHNGNIWNERADLEAKNSLESNDHVIFNDNFSYFKYRVNWNFIPVDKNNREFIKSIDYIHNKWKWSNTNRLKTKLNWKKRGSKVNLITRIINARLEEIDETRKINKNIFKALKIKLLYNELPTIEKLKKRNNSVYKEDWKCPGCGIKEETLDHILNCSSTNNDMVTVCVNAELEMMKYLNKEKYTNIVDPKKEFLKLFKYTQTKKHLLYFNNETNTRHYINTESKDGKKTYIWDHQGCIDDIIMGHFDQNLMDIMVNLFSYKKKGHIKSDGIDILVNWINKILYDFMKKVWNNRCKRTIEWEKEKGIDVKIKRNFNVKEKKHRNIGGKSTNEKMREQSENKGKKKDTITESDDIYKEDSWNLYYITKNWVVKRIPLESQLDSIRKSKMFVIFYGRFIILIGKIS